VSLKDVERAIQEELEHSAAVVALSAYDLTGVWYDIRRIANACGVPEDGTDLVRSLEQRLQALASSVEGRPKPRVACIEWLDPLMPAGNWVPELVHLAGGRDVLGEAGQHSRFISGSVLANADPDVIIALPCGFDLARTERELAMVVKSQEWQKLRAVRNGRVYCCDGNQYMNRPGPRVVESLQIFAEILHPDDAGAALRGTGWRRFEASC
jgi:iron complex transport system substrate-binding protein